MRSENGVPSLRTGPLAWSSSIRLLLGLDWLGWLALDHLDGDRLLRTLVGGLADLVLEIHRDGPVDVGKALCVELEDAGQHVGADSVAGARGSVDGHRELLGAHE